VQQVPVDPRRPGPPGGPQAGPVPAYPAPTGVPFGTGNRRSDDRDFGDRTSGNGLDDLRGRRQERVEDGGRRIIIEEPGDRRITREGDRLSIRHNETERFRESYRDADVRSQRRGDVDVTVFRQPGGVEIVTERDEDGNLLRRIRRDPAGREVILIENRRDGRARTPYGYVGEDVVRLPPPRILIPRDEYVVDVEGASQDDLYAAFAAPAVEPITRAYSLDEVRQSQVLRDRVRRVDVDTITFDSGSWILSQDQVGALTGIGTALRRTLDQNPNEIFLVEGYTDAVGPPEDNLSLSDRRAETVATVLSQSYGIPAENLTTQGFGEQDLKVATQESERRNRRVTIRRITPLLQGQR